MQFTPRIQKILETVCEHFTVTAAQVRRCIFAAHQDRDGRQTRRLLNGLFTAKLVAKCRMQVVDPLHGLVAPVYFPTRLGAEALAMHTGEPRWLRTPTQTPQWQNLAHWVALTDLRMVVNAALARQSLVSMPSWFNEFDVVSESENPAERYRLYTCGLETVAMPHGEREKRWVCNADAAFCLAAAGVQKAFYVELERGNDPIQKCAAEKTPGYAKLDALKLHRRHFPSAIDKFTVLVVAPTPNRALHCRRHSRRDQPAHLYKFAAVADLTAAAFLSEPVWHPCVGEPVSLLKGGAHECPDPVRGVSSVGKSASS